MDKLEKPLILLVDDRPENLLALEAILTGPELELVKVTSGQEALWQLSQQKFALVILDVQMPGMDGFETARLMRDWEETKYIPIIFATAISKDQKHQFKGYESGAVDYLFKPIEPVILKSKVQVFLELYQQKKLIEKRTLELQESEEKFRSISASAQDAIILIDNDGNITYWNKAAERILGYSANEIMGKNIIEIYPQEHRHDFMKGFKHFKDTGQGPAIGKLVEFSAQRKDGTQIPIELSLSALKIKNKWAAAGMIRDITYRKLAEQRLEFQAYFDGLTGLPNRRLFFDRLKQSLALAQRDDDLFALLFLDLDHFKNVNDTYGHEVGDLLLKEAALRLKDCLRQSDTAARVGGDEFVVILPKIAERQEAELVAGKIIGSLTRPFHLSGQECSIGTSIGISIYPADGQEAETLLNNADAAMYYVKKESRNAYKFYSPKMQVGALERSRMRSSLYRAVERQEFVLHYQPQMDISSRRITGIEALVRWEHPDKGLIPPIEFLHLAEETGLIVKLDEWVMRTACAQVRAWRKEGLPSIRVSVNISNLMFKQPKQVDRINSMLKQTGLSPDCFELELTENILMRNSNIDTLNAFKYFGISLCLDDFGTGYSSLSYLKRLPLSKLKIDRPFIRNLPDNPVDVSIISAIINLAHSLDLKVVAEGVETREQLEILSSLKCDSIQGFVFCKPLPANDFIIFFNSNISNPNNSSVNS